MPQNPNTKGALDMEQHKCALLTGASSGIGLAIAELLLKEGWQVYGIGREFPECPGLSVPAFHPVCQDLTQTGRLPGLIKTLKNQSAFSLLINNAGVGYFGPHEELNAAKIHEMVTVNLEVPLLLTQLLLRDLKKEQGMVINISSVTAKKSSPHGCAYGSTKAALSSFTASLFDEVRRYGVRAAAIHPDMTRSNFYRNADFTAAEEDDASLTPEQVAAAVGCLLTLPPGTAVTDITLQPQKNRIERKRAKNNM